MGIKTQTYVTALMIEHMTKVFDLLDESREEYQRKEYAKRREQREQSTTNGDTDASTEKNS